MWKSKSCSADRVKVAITWKRLGTERSDQVNLSSLRLTWQESHHHKNPPVLPDANTFSITDAKNFNPIPNRSKNTTKSTSGE